MDDAAPQNVLKLMTQLDVVIQIIKLKWGGEFVVSVIIYCDKITMLAQCCVAKSWITKSVLLEADPYKGVWVWRELVCREIW